MSEAMHKQSPLAQRDVAGEGGLRLSERPFLGYLNLRGRPGEAAFLEAAKSVLGMDLPLEPNTTAAADGLTVLWLGPDEWLVITAPDAQTQLAERLEAAFDGLLTAVTDISSGHTMLVASGPRARALLARGCTLDLHPRAFAPGQCAQTLVAKASVLIHRPRGAGDSTAFELLVRRSFAEYLWLWLRDAAADTVHAVT